MNNGLSGDHDTGSTDPLNRTVRFEYDGMGNRTLKIDPRGVVCTYIYSANNELIKELYPSGRRDTYTCDENGNRTLMHDASGRYTTTYDRRNLVETVLSPPNKLITYTYDELARRKTMTDPDGGVQTFSYTQENQIQKIVNAKGKVTTFSYDEAGQLTLKQLGNGGKSTYTYDCNGKELTIANYKNATDPVNIFTYTYNGVSMRTTALELGGALTTWTYDEDYQLLSEGRIGSVSFSATYIYDAAGNRTKKTEISAVTTYVYDDANELSTEQTQSGITTYTYDLCGNRESKNALGVLTYFTWDEPQRLAKIEPVSGTLTLAYNADGRRVTKDTLDGRTNYLYDFKRLLQEADGDGEVQHAYTSTTDEYGDLISEFCDDGAHDFLFDANGDADAVLSFDGTVASAYKYKAFGPTPLVFDTCDNHFTYVGKLHYVHDDEVSLFFAGARYYDPDAGRWLSEDPTGYRAGDENLYRYVGNNPVNATDPSGYQGTTRSAVWNWLHPEDVESDRLQHQERPRLADRESSLPEAVKKDLIKRRAIQEQFLREGQPQEAAVVQQAINELIASHAGMHYDNDLYRDQELRIRRDADSAISRTIYDTYRMPQVPRRAVFRSIESTTGIKEQEIRDAFLFVKDYNDRQRLPSYVYEDEHGRGSLGRPWDPSQVNQGEKVVFDFTFDTATDPVTYALPFAFSKASKLLPAAKYKGYVDSSEAFWKQTLARPRPTTLLPVGELVPQGRIIIPGQTGPVAAPRSIEIPGAPEPMPGAKIILPGEVSAGNPEFLLGPDGNPLVAKPSAQPSNRLTLPHSSESMPTLRQLYGPEQEPLYAAPISERLDAYKQWRSGQGKPTAAEFRRFVGAHRPESLGTTLYFNDTDYGQWLQKTTSQHGNIAGNQPAWLYALLAEDESFLKWGITQDLDLRYGGSFLEGKKLIPLEQLPRHSILKKERFLVERFPGPLNREPWAGTEPMGLVPEDPELFWKELFKNRMTRP